jgi:hypothetical protein
VPASGRPSGWAPPSWSPRVRHAASWPETTATGWWCKPDPQPALRCADPVLPQRLLKNPLSSLVCMIRHQDINVCVLGGGRSSRSSPLDGRSDFGRGYTRNSSRNCLVPSGLGMSSPRGGSQAGAGGAGPRDMHVQAIAGQGTSSPSEPPPDSGRPRSCTT